MSVKVSLKYNPFTVKTNLKIDNDLIENSDNSDLFDIFNNKRLSDYIDRFLEKLHETYMENKYNIIFEGTVLDAEDLKNAVQSNKKDKDRFIIDYSGAKDVTPENKIKDLKQLFEKAKEGPFEELKGDEMKNNFYEALDPNFEVNVIATMSAGKSTVINAMLGTELLPAKNEACTATIARIENRDGMNHFEAKRLDNNHDVIDDWQEASRKILTGWNDDKDTSFIDIRGNIPAISEKEGVRIVFIDTPGPNNSNNMEHRKVTINAITGKPLSMVLYVLNASQLGTTDDQELLEIVRDAMAEGGRKAQDRFVFIINKIDEFDPENGDSVKDAICNTKKYLRENGIENPLVIPASAKLTKLVRISKNGGEESMTDKQKKWLNNHKELFAQEPEMDMLEHVKPFINKGVYDRLKDLLSIAQSDKEKAEILSGIPIVEELFENFLNKHALPSKIKDAVDSFNNLINKTQIIKKNQTILEQNESECKKIVEALNNFEQNNDRIKEAQEFRSKVNLLKYKKTKDLSDEEKKVSRKFEEAMDSYREIFENDLEPDKAKRIIKNAETAFNRTFSDIQTILSQGMEKNFYIQLDHLRDDYQKFVAELIEKEFPGDENIDLQGLQQASMKMPDTKTLISNNTKDVRIKTGTHQASDSKWYNPFSWGRKRTVTDYKYVEKVNMAEVWNKMAI